MSTLKGIALIAGILVYIAIGFVLRILLFLSSPAIYFKFISRWTRLLCRFLRTIVNVRVALEGNISGLKEHGNLIVSNHLGYLDGVILGSLCDLVFVSKSQVKSWPLFGLMSQIGGTIFIERGKRNKSVNYIQQARVLLEHKINVLVFPEGTSTNGERLLPFQSVHFQAALDAQASILPIGIRYSKINQQDVHPGNRDILCWYGQKKLHKHVHEILKLKTIAVTLTVYPAINTGAQATAGYSRKDISGVSHRVIAQSYPLFHAGAALGNGCAERNEKLGSDKNGEAYARI